MARWGWLHYHLALESKVVIAGWGWLHYHLASQKKVVRAMCAWLHYHLALEHSGNVKVGMAAIPHWS